VGANGIRLLRGTEQAVRPVFSAALYRETPVKTHQKLADSTSSIMNCDQSTENIWTWFSNLLHQQHSQEHNCRSKALITSSSSCLDPQGPDLKAFGSSERLKPTVQLVQPSSDSRNKTEKIDMGPMMQQTMDDGIQTLVSQARSLLTMASLFCIL
jgi:hypothetical protein